MNCYEIVYILCEKIGIKVSRYINYNYINNYINYSYIFIFR